MAAIIDPYRWQMKPPRGLRLCVDPGHPLARHLVAFWPMNDGHGAVVRDAGPHRIHGTITGGTVSWNARGMFSPHLDFAGDNTTDRVDLGVIPVGHPLQLTDTDELTLITQCLLTTGAVTSNAPRIFDKSNGALAANGWALYPIISAGSELTLAVAGTEYQATALAVERGRMVTLAVTKKKSAYIRFFAGQGTSTASPVGRIRFIQELTTGIHSFPSAQTSAAIGNWNHTTDRQWDEDINWLMILNKALGLREIQELACRPYSLLRPSPVLTPTFIFENVAPPIGDPGKGSIVIAIT